MRTGASSKTETRSPVPNEETMRLLQLTYRCLFLSLDQIVTRRAPLVLVVFGCLMIITYSVISIGLRDLVDAR
jgi:hypothetical protein